MRNVLVIADDFTGAAEIAGIGSRHGLPTRILRRPPARVELGLTVLDTDSRLFAPHVAATIVAGFVEPLRGETFDLVFKKTDSVLRGPVAAEFEALATALGRSSVLFVPQNPSLGRVIVGGEYRVNGVPLHETSFAKDPIHPAHSSNAAELLGPHVTPITIGDAETAADISGWALRTPPTALPAGGADFFTAQLGQGGLAPTRPFLGELPDGPRLFIFGSTQPYPFISNVAARPMMDAADVWCDAVSRLLEGGFDAAMTIDRPLDAAPGAAAGIEHRVATVAAAALRRTAVRTLFVTGGATAAAVCREMGWSDFAVEGELAPGVVQLRPQRAAQTSVIVKPGSYPWPPQLETTGRVSMTDVRGGPGRP